MSTSRLLPLLLLTACAGRAAPEATIIEAPGTTNQLVAGGHDVHALLLYEDVLGLGPGAADPDLLRLPPMISTLPFNEVVPSWNVDLPPGSGFRAQLRVVSLQDDATSSWYDLGAWGLAPEGEPGAVRDELGVVDVDVLRCERTFEMAEVRFALRAAPDGRLPHVRRVALCVSNTMGDPDLAAEHAAPLEQPPTHLWQRRLDVPFRSQRSEDPAIAGRICSPTSVAMVLAYHGVERPTAQVAARTYDAEHDIYGGWARAVQAAFEGGAPGFVMRYASLEELYPHIAEGRPVIVSIRVSEGELRGAPYPSTSGHLIVVTGFDAEGDVHVNDPAAADPAQGVVTYAREDMERVWLARGGVAYVLLPPGS